MSSKLAAAALALLFAAAARGDGVFLVDTGTPDGKMAMASRTSSAGKIEIEAADDFLLPCATTIESASFTGLLPAAEVTVEQVVVEIYRVFPEDSDTSRTPNVPTRTNSPSDVAFASRDSVAGGLTFTPNTISASFTAANSVINSISVASGGDGPVTGSEIGFSVTFTPAISLPAGHYFFVPQVRLDSGDFYWLSAPHPVGSFSPDLQAWIRNEDLAPDWLRVGTDIVGGVNPPQFNGSFTLSGTTSPLSVQASASSPFAATPGVPIAPITFSAPGGTGPFTFGATGDLAGLSLDTSTGVLSGTPIGTGDFPFMVSVTDALGCTGDAAFSLRLTTQSDIPTLGGPALALLAAGVALAGAFVLRR